jgi:acetate---CoA ligase (ADP-forming)
VLGKPLVVLKAGRSATAAAAATAHTGALVGDDTMFTGLCRQYGIVKVRSVEELVVTADVLSKVPVLSGSGIGYLSISGGLCEIGADLADEEDLTLPALRNDTAEKLRGILPSFATVQNPLDMTANVTSDPSLFERVVTALGQDRGLSLLACIFDVPTGEGDIASFSRPALQHIGRALREDAVPLLVISTAVKPVTAMSRQMIADYGLPYISGGIDLGLRAIREATRWSAYQRNRVPTVAQVSPVANQAVPLPRSEFEARGHLESFDVPLVPAVLAGTPAEAVVAAQRFGGPVVLKIASPDIAHKTEIGGVVLNLEGEAVVGHAFHDIMTRARHARPHATIEGILVSPMRKSGVELLVGITRDPQWGLVLTLGIGGIWVELLKDVSTRLLPLNVAKVLVMLEELRVFRLLAGYRGVRPVNLAQLAQIIVQIGDAARALGPRLQTLEINPLLAQGDTIEALDALVVATDR